MEKKNITYESIERNIDTETGEVKELKTIQTVKVDKEPDFIKLYLNTVCVFKGLSQSATPVLFEFCKYMTYANNADGQIIMINSYIKEKISEELNLSVKRINQVLTSIIKSGIFKRIENKRGIYIVNPYIIGKGEWKDIKELRANFNFNTGDIELDIDKNED